MEVRPMEKATLQDPGAGPGLPTVQPSSTGSTSNAPVERAFRKNYRSHAEAAALAGRDVSQVPAVPRATIRECLRDLATGLALTVALWCVAAGIWDASVHCSFHPDFVDECRCSVGDAVPAQVIYMLCFGVGSLWSWFMVVERLRERHDHARAALGKALLFAVPQTVLLVIVPADGGGEGSMVVSFVLFEMVLAVTWLLHGRRARALAVRIFGVMLLTGAVTGVYHSAKDSANFEVMLALFPIVVNCVESLLIASFRCFMSTWSSAEMSVMGCVLTASMEALRVGVLVASIESSSGAFWSALLVAIPVEVLSQNDLHWTLVYKLLLRWSDYDVHRRFTKPKGVHIATRYYAVYAPVLCLLLARTLQFERIPNLVLETCEGGTTHLLLPDWEHLFAILGAEITTDVIAAVVNRRLAKWRPYLARDLSIDVPAARVERVVLVWATMSQAALALVPAATILSD